MTKAGIFLSTALCMTTLSANAQRTYLDQTTIDHSVKPGDDFFNYANGGWIKANEIPATEASWGNGPLSNFEPFYAAFGINQGDPMWRPVSERIVIW